MLISDKIDLKKAIEKDKEGQYIMTKGSIQKGDVILINTYAPNLGELKHIKQTTDIKGETDRNIITGDINIILTSTDTHSGHKINMATEVLHDTIEQLRLNWHFKVF